MHHGLRRRPVDDRLLVTVLLDGAMGTELERRGARMQLPLWSAQALVDDPALVQAIHRDYLLAGAQVISTNTFRTHARDLRGTDHADEAKRLTALAVHLALQAREEAASEHEDLQRAVIAGSMSPLEDCFAPERSPIRARALPEHREIAEHLAQAGVDLLLIETMGRIDECCAAIEAAATTGLPLWLSVVARSDGQLLGGESFDALIRALHGQPVQALLINCTQLTDLPIVMPALLAAVAQAPTTKTLACGLFPHTGHNDPKLGWQTHTSDPESFADRLFAELRAHPALQLVGSCCGSTPEWTRALGRRVHPDRAARTRGFDELAALLSGTSPPRATQVERPRSSC